VFLSSKDLSSSICFSLSSSPANQLHVLVSDFEMVSYLGVVLKWGEQKLGVSAGIVSIPIKI